MIHQRLQMVALNKGLWWFLIALLPGCDSTALDPVVDLTSAAQGAFAIVDVNVIPMDTEHVLKDQTVVIEFGTIKAMGPSASTDIPEGVTMIDGAGKYLIPGLADMHTHPGYDTDLLFYLAYGVTTILDMGHAGDQIYTWREAVNDGTMLGPTIYSAGRVIDGKARESDAFDIVFTADEARQVVRRQKAEGVDLLKVYNDLSLECFEAVVDEGRKQDLVVVGHGVRRVGLGRALQEGQVMVAHGEEVVYTFFASGQVPGQISTAARLFTDNNAYLTPNLSTYGAVVRMWGNTAGFNDMLQNALSQHLDPRWANRWRDKFDDLYEDKTGSLRPTYKFLQRMTREMSDEGVQFILGTDSPQIPGMMPGASLWLDMEELVGAGLTPYAALVAGTRNAGTFVDTFISGNESFGTIEAGRRADLLLLNSNPLDEIMNVSDQAGVFVRGAWLPKSEIDRRISTLVNSY